MEVTVGVFMFMVLLALGMFTIVLSRDSFFVKRYTVEIVFDSIMGLREGDNISVRGVDIGKIRALRVEKNSVRVIASMIQPLEFHEDYKVEILPSSVLGGRYLSIYEGTPAKPLLPPGTVLRGETPVDLIDEATRTVKSLRNALEDGGILDNLKLVMKQIETVTAKMSKGEGTIGKLLMDETVYNDVQKIAANLKEVSQNLADGQGTLGKLMSKDEKLYQDIEKIAANLKEVSQNLADGQGTLGKLMSKDDKLYEDLSAAAASIRKITDKIEKGEGTLGKLINDDSLYVEAKLTLQEIRAGIDDLRETTPITTFTSIFLGTF